MPEAPVDTPVTSASPVPTKTRVYLGFDYGLKRIGLAVGDDLTRLARPLPVLSNGREPDWQSIDKLLREWRPDAAIVGLPVTMDGGDQPITGPARQFAETLRRRYGLPVFMVDERMSSRAADDEIRSARADGRKKNRVQKGERDGVAARLILEQYLSGDTAKFWAVPGPTPPRAEAS